MRVRVYAHISINTVNIKHDFDANLNIQSSLFEAVYFQKNKGCCGSLESLSLFLLFYYYYYFLPSGVAVMFLLFPASLPPQKLIV